MDFNFTSSSTTVAEIKNDNDKVVKKMIYGTAPADDGKNHRVQIELNDQQAKELETIEYGQAFKVSGDYQQPKSLSGRGTITNAEITRDPERDLEKVSGVVRGISEKQDSNGKDYVLVSIKTGEHEESRVDPFTKQPITETIDDMAYVNTRPSVARQRGIQKGDNIEVIGNWNVGNTKAKSTWINDAFAIKNEDSKARVAEATKEMNRGREDAEIEKTPKVNRKKK